VLAGCSGSGLEGLDPATPSYASPTSATDNASGPAADRADIVSLTDEQDQQINPDAAFVPMPRPAEAAVAATDEASATTVAAAEPTSAAPLPTSQTTSATPAAVAADNADQRVASAFATPAQPTPAAKKQGFLAGLFAQKPQSAPVMSRAPAEPPKPVLQLASADPKSAAVSAMPRSSADIDKPATQSLGSDLPGVRKSSLFEITRKNGIDDDSDVDLHEDEEAPTQIASAAGMARLAPNGLLKQRDSVDVSCLKPSLVRMLKQIEGHYGKRIVVTSGYRSPAYNRKVRGARKSMHMYCAAVDVQLDGISKWELARFARSMPGRGGVGTYCHTESIHIDVGPERDWNWRCRSRRKG